MSCVDGFNFWVESSFPQLEMLRESKGDFVLGDDRPNPPVNRSLEIIFLDGVQHGVLCKEGGVFILPELRDIIPHLVVVNRFLNLALFGYSVVGNSSRNCLERVVCFDRVVLEELVGDLIYRFRSCCSVLLLLR